MLVNFFLVGASKAGTTWVYKALKEHPDVFLSDVKESKFFDRNFDKGISWYHSFYKEQGGEKIIGDISPTYLSSDLTAQRIFEYNPESKILFILRNPIERAYSAYCMNLRGENRATRDIENFIRPEAEDVDYGLYFYHMREFLKYFPSDQIKIMFYDDLKEQPENFMLGIYSFLDICQEFIPTSCTKTVNVRKPLRKFQRTCNKIGIILDHIRKIKYGNYFVNKLQTSMIWDFFRKLNPTDDYPVLTTEMKKSLVDYYREDVLKLSGLTDRDLSHWLKIND